MVVKAPRINLALPRNLRPDATVQLLQLFLLGLVGFTDFLSFNLLLLERLKQEPLIVGVAVKVKKVALAEVFQSKLLKFDPVHDANSVCPVRLIQPFPQLFDLAQPVLVRLVSGHCIYLCRKALQTCRFWATLGFLSCGVFGHRYPCLLLLESILPTAVVPRKLDSESTPVH